MNDQDLIHATIELLGWSPSILNQPGYSIDQFLERWDVAGALMEKVLDGARDRKDAWRKIDPQGAWISLTKPISVPRAIIEACVEALTNDST